LYVHTECIKTIIISLPVLVVTSAILYRRGEYGLSIELTTAYLGEQQRTIPQDVTAQVSEKVSGPIGGAPWEVHRQER
jgi:hypothetical protein